MIKIHKILALSISLLLVLMALALASCHQSRADDEPKPPVPTETETESPVAPDPEEESKGGETADANRTVLVYMVATNNLGSANLDREDLKEMVQAYAKGNISNGRLLVYHAPYSGDILLKEITANGVDTLKQYASDVVSVSSTQMRQVIADVKSIAPADDYGLVLWSHASGWLQDGLDEEASLRPVMYSFGSDRSKKMNITTLASVLRGQGFSFIYFDCCYMGTVEVMYELRDVVKTVVASPTEIHLKGMPYQLNMECFFKDEPDLVQAATNTFEYYYKTYTPSECPLSFGVIDMSQIDSLAQITKEIYSQADTFYPSGYSPQRMSSDRTCYYFDFEDYVKALCVDQALMDEWNQAMSKAVIYKAHAESLWGEYDLTRFGGLSTFIPSTQADTTKKGYQTLQWYDDVARYLYETE